MRVDVGGQADLGAAVGELLSRPFLDIVHPDDLQSSRDAFADLERGEDVIGFVSRFICADSSVRWLKWNTRTMPHGFFEVSPVRKIQVQPKQRDNAFCGSAISLFMNVTTSIAPSARCASKYHHS